MSNPYLVGYEQYVRRQNSERNRADSPTQIRQPTHPMLGKPAGVITTTAPSTSREQADLSRPTLPGGASIDIRIPGAMPTFQPFPHDGMDAAANMNRLSTPATVNFIARPPSAGAGQPLPPAVEITIGEQSDEEREVHQYESHLAGLTVQQMLDLDIDALVLKIDTHHNNAKKAVLDHFIDTKARLMQAQNDALDDERQNCAARLATKEEELNLLKGELGAMRAKAERLGDLASRACAAYGQAKESRRDTVLLFRIFYAWREQAMLMAKHRRLLARAEHWDNNVRLKRNIFRAWFRAAIREHRVTLNNRYIQEVDNAKRQIHEHYQGQIVELQRMLSDAQVQVEREAEARSRQEEVMKRAFMRGVCALNIEAMNLMKRGGAPGGASPVGNQPSSAPDTQPPESTSGASSAPAPGPNGMAMPESTNGDLRGSITLAPQPTFAAQAPGPSGQTSTPAATSGYSTYAATTGSGATRLSGSGMSQGPASYAVGGGASSRPVSSCGSNKGAGGNLLVVKAAVAQTPTGNPGYTPAEAIANPDGGPVLRETAQSYYQRPQVLVTRGPGVSQGGPAPDAPRPRAMAPLPTVRLT